MNTLPRLGAAVALSLAASFGLAACSNPSGSQVVSNNGAHTPHSGGASATSSPGSGSGAGSGSGTGSGPSSSGTGTGTGSSSSSLNGADSLLIQLDAELASLGAAVNQSTTDLSNPQADS